MKQYYYCSLTCSHRVPADLTSSMVSLAAVTAFDHVHVLVLVLTSLFLSFLFLSQVIIKWFGLWATHPIFCRRCTCRMSAIASFCKGYNPTITASRHLIGKDSFIISLAVSINLINKIYTYKFLSLFMTFNASAHL